MQTPPPERPEAAQVAARRGEPLEKSRQHRLAGHPLDPQQFRHQWIAAQIGNMGELARVAQQSVHEGQRLFQRQQLVVGKRRRMRQRGGQGFAPIQRMQPGPEQSAARVRGKLLIREADGDCLAVAFELKCPGHRLVIRARARRLRCFHTPPINPQSVAPFQLHGFGLNPRLKPRANFGRLCRGFHSCQFVKWTRSRPLARPRALRPALRDKFLSPHPRRLKSCQKNPRVRKFRRRRARIPSRPNPMARGGKSAFARAPKLVEG
jgi:hypothetical protein